MYTVLHTESSKGWGGQESRTLQESTGLRKLGARAVILCQPESVLGQRAEAEGLEVRTCMMRKSYDLFAVRYILRLLKAENVDVISTHSGRDSFLAGVAGRISGKKPVIVRTRHLAMPITSRISYSLLPHRVITVSEYVRSYLIREGINAGRIVAIPTGVDISRFSPGNTGGGLRGELGLQKDVPLVGTVGILRIKKGHHILLNAIPLVLREIPDAMFVFAGDGPQKRNILNKIEGLGLRERVYMLGLRRDIPNILDSIDLFVLPTLQEALGTSFIEAMAMEKPVIGTKVGGVGEVIKDGVNGYLVEPENPSALAAAMVRALKDRKGARNMGREGRKMVLEQFTVEKMCERIHALYLSLLRGKNP
jgi:glycosyltransferase involved in cell wall biosynthesis